jgi:hypothetical protein
MANVLSITLTPSQINDGSGLYKSFPGNSITQYQHTISALGGYDTCQVALNIKKIDLDNFLTNTLGCSIKVYNEETDTIWDGFVNEITTTYNNTDIVIGPLIDITNQIKVKYSEFTTGVPGVTLYANDILSQKRYGTFTKILTASSVSAVNADNIRNNYLEENRFPFYSVGLTIQDNVTFSVTLNCLGMHHILNTYVYNNAGTGVSTARQKILTILAANPKELFSSHGLIGTNTLSVPVLENEDRLAWDVIKEVVSLGSDVNNDRMTFGIYNNRSIIYRRIPNEVRYFYRSFNNNKYLTNNAGGRVSISSFKPGHYIGIADVPDIMGSGLKSIPKYIFAEVVSYSAPYGLTITGSNVSTLAQRVAKLGLGGL